MNDTMDNPLRNRLRDVKFYYDAGWISAISGHRLTIQGLTHSVRHGDQITLSLARGKTVRSEVIGMSPDGVVVLPEADFTGIALGARAVHLGPPALRPSNGCLGRLLTADGDPSDGKGPYLQGAKCNLWNDPPAPYLRQPLGARFNCGAAALNTMLPIVEGQRIGLFAGAGVGKTSLISYLAQTLNADVTVLALIGERGQEVAQFSKTLLTNERRGKTVIVATTSEEPPQRRRRTAWTGMSIAEHFRAQGKKVVLLLDSVTRFAEAHREIELASGGLASMRGFPPSTLHQLMSLSERAGPGPKGEGSITAIFSVLVAGSDMESPIADMLRGALDGHIVLSRDIAERGRFPAIDIARSLSRALPDCATNEQNLVIAEARKLISKFTEAELMIKAGLYANGSDPDLDRAIGAWPAFEQLWTETDHPSVKHSFDKLELILKRNGWAPPPGTRPVQV